MRKNEREWIRPLAALMDEMDANTVHLSFEVSESIEGRLMPAPVVGALPIIDEVFKVIEIGARLPMCSRHLVRPPRVSQAVLQIGQYFRSDIDSEWSDQIVLHKLSLKAPAQWPDAR